MNQFIQLIEMLDHYKVDNASDAREIRELIKVINTVD